MSETQVSKSNTLLTFLGSLGAILIFVLILFIAYLPNRPAAVNAQVSADRQAKADEARAAGIQKLNNYQVLDAESGTVRIPITEAMQLTVAAYNNPTSAAEPEVAEVVEAVVEPVVAEVVDTVVETVEAVAEPVTGSIVEPTAAAAKEAAHDVE